MLPIAALAMAATPAPSAQFQLEGSLTQGGVVVGTAPAGTKDLQLDGQAVFVEPDGRFLIAFDRDAKPQSNLVAHLANGQTIARSLTISARSWRIERINAPMRPSASTEAFMELRRPELARIAAARSILVQSDGWRQSFIWPRTGRISGLFGAQRIYQGVAGAYHGGVDVAAPTGASLVSPANGVVVLAADKPFSLEGNLLIIDHGQGLNSAFLHLSRIDVKQGDVVRQGQQIGAVGATGRVTGPHMHWALKWKDVRLDPLLLAGPMPTQ